ncbi:hypothetical protein J7E63_10650 [Bacillus sp. ISL-75]|nr:hypothetical protein [Bacillus sp. ISL-75]
MTNKSSFKIKEKNNISTRDIDRIYNHLALESFDKEDPVTYILDYLIKRTPSDTEFYLSFQSREFTRSPQTKYILEMIGNALTNNTIGNLPLLGSQLNIGLAGLLKKYGGSRTYFNFTGKVN